MIPLTMGEYESYLSQIKCHICKTQFNYKLTNDKNYSKVKDHYNYTDKYKSAAHNICNLKHSIPKEIPVVFYNRSNNDYPFVKEELTKEF